jgi:hypothetical protein
VSDVTNKEFYAWFVDSGYTAYGAEVPVEDVQAFLKLDYPETACKKVYDALTLIELGYIDYVRNMLLNEGKYLTNSRGVYRVLLPSENAAQVERYVSGASKRLNRALKLSKNTPAEYKKPNDNTAIRIELKKKSIREAHRFGEV